MTKQGDVFKITLNINGAEKTFFQPFVSGKIFRKTLEFEKEWREIDNDPIKELDLFSEYVPTVFNNQFTPDDFINGVSSHELIKEALRIKFQVQTGRATAYEEYLKSQAELLGIDYSDEENNSNPNV